MYRLKRFIYSYLNNRSHGLIINDYLVCIYNTNTAQNKKACECPRYNTYIMGYDNTRYIVVCGRCNKWYDLKYENPLPKIGCID